MASLKKDKGGGAVSEANHDDESLGDETPPLKSSSCFTDCLLSPDIPSFFGQLVILTSTGRSWMKSPPNTMFSSLEQVGFDPAWRGKNGS